MSETNGQEILDAVIKIHETVLQIQQDGSETKAVVQLLDQKLIQINGSVKKHESILYGDPEQMGKGGLLSTISEQDQRIKDADKKAEGVGKRIDNLRGTVLLVWSGIFSVLQLAISFFRGH